MFNNCHTIMTDIVQSVFLEIKLVSFSNTCSLICCFQSGSKHMKLCQESQMISPGPEAIKRFSSSA